MWALFVKHTWVIGFQLMTHLVDRMTRTTLIGGSINWAIEEIIVLSLWQSAKVLGGLKVNQVAYSGAYARKSGGFGDQVLE